MITEPPKSPPTTIILWSSHSAGVAVKLQSWGFENRLFPVITWQPDRKYVDSEMSWRHWDTSQLWGESRESNCFIVLTLLPFFLSQSLSLTLTISVSRTCTWTYAYPRTHTVDHTWTRTSYSSKSGSQRWQIWPKWRRTSISAVGEYNRCHIN